MPVQYGREAAHISWAGLWADSTWGLQGGEATPSQRELFSRTEKETEVEILPCPNSKSLDALHLQPPTSFVGRGDFNSRLVTVVYYETRTSLTGRRYFMWAQIFSWTQIFHGHEYFMGVNISWSRIFYGRKYFMGVNISWARIFWCKRIFCV